MPIALVDYGAGNLTSVRKAFTFLGAEICTPASAAELSRATAVDGAAHRVFAMREAPNVAK